MTTTGYSAAVALPAAGFAIALLTAPVVLGVDALHKRVRAGRHRVTDTAA